MLSVGSQQLYLLDHHDHHDRFPTGLETFWEFDTFLYLNSDVFRSLVLCNEYLYPPSGYWGDKQQSAFMLMPEIRAVIPWLSFLSGSSMSVADSWFSVITFIIAILTQPSITLCLGISVLLSTYHRLCRYMYLRWIPKSNLSAYVKLNNKICYSSWNCNWFLPIVIN